MSVPEPSTSRRFTYANGHEPLATRAAYLATLGPDWDSYGSVAINRAAIRRALRFVEVTQPTLEPSLWPLPSGGCELHYESGDDPEAVIVEFAADPDSDTVFVEIVETADA
jgi:hypothetical protein